MFSQIQKSLDDIQASKDILRVEIKKLDYQLTLLTFKMSQHSSTIRRTSAKEGLEDFDAVLQQYKETSKILQKKELEYTSLQRKYDKLFREMMSSL